MELKLILLEYVLNHYCFGVFCRKICCLLSVVKLDLFCHCEGFGGVQGIPEGTDPKSIAMQVAASIAQR